MRIILTLLIFVNFNLYAQDNCNLDVDGTAKKHYNKAKRLADDLRFSESLQLLNKAIEVQSDYPNAYFLMGRIYELKKDMLNAKTYYEKTIEVCPMHSPLVYWFLASSEMDNKSFKKAKKYFTRYLEFLSLPQENKVMARHQLKIAEFFDDMYSNPVPFSPKPVKGVCTSDDEYLSALSPDNEFAYFTRRSTKQEIGMLRPETVEEFIISHKKEGYFDAGEKMLPPFNLRSNEGGPSLSIDNRELFFTICSNEKGYKNCDIYYSKMKYENWSDLKRLKYPVNKSDSWESQPTISSDGNTLIFSSIRSGGVGGSDLYSVTRDESGNWGDLKSLNINTEGNEKSPFLHPDSETLYFSSDTHLGLGGLDIFYCKKDSTCNWANPINIGYPINSENDDLAFFVSTDGKTAYFSSNKLSGVGGWDLYEFPLYKAARPEKVLFLKGEVKAEQGELLFDAVVEVKSMKTKEVTRVEVNQESGQYVGVINVEEDEDVMVTVKTKDYAFNSQYISADDKEYQKPSQLDFKMQSIEEGKSFRINNIYFDTDAFDLNSQAQNVLTSFTDFMDLNTSVSVAIHGHTDDVGYKISNLELSTKRAKEVHDYLIKIGVDASRLSFKGFGESKPLVENNSEKGRATNRRTEFFITKK
jgi:outer membrane protein OmpA-like peptidoglycan-associated protein/tetratricopeptide (TPR) repeat protein